MKRHPMRLPDPHSINSLPLRTAMGLPTEYVAGQLNDNLPLADSRGLLGEPGDALSHLIREGYPPPLRYLAGTVLALAGDPRIQPLNPKMLPVPGGLLRMGTEASEVDRVLARFNDLNLARQWIEKEVPTWTVSIAPFRLGRYPVTNLKYVAFLQDCPEAALPTSWAFGQMPPEHANHPVYSVPLEAAHQYVAWLSQKTSRPFRLPTEAEWEWAASGGDDREYPWGSAWAEDCANTAESRCWMTTPVGMFPKGAGPFGHLDLAGNVEELVDTYYGPYPGGRWIDDDLASSGPYPMTRGGSFTRFRDLGRCKRRHGYLDHPLYAIGFRIAEDMTD